MLKQKKSEASLYLGRHIFIKVKRILILKDKGSNKDKPINITS